MERRPLIAVAVCWLLGMSVPAWCAGPWQAAALSGALLTLLGCLLAGWCGGRLAGICAVALLLAYGECVYVTWRDRSDLDALWQAGDTPERAELRGVIRTKPEIDGDVVTFRLAARSVAAVNGTAAAGTAVVEANADTDEMVRIRETVVVRVKLTAQAEQERAAAWRRGDPVRVAGTPEKPLDAGNFGMFDYRRYLATQGIYWSWSAAGADAVRRESGAVSPLWLPARAVDRLRDGIGRIADRLYPGGDAGYMKGLVAGITDDVDPLQYDAFSRLGLSHVLAISGLHVGVVVLLLLQLGALLRLTRERAIDVAIAAMPVYMLLTGASPSAVRACLMAMIALAMARANKLRDGLHLLAAAALLMTMWDPRVLLNVSFQLSFAVTAGLLLFTPIVSRLLPAWIRPAGLRSALAVGLTAQAVSFPLSVYYFHGFHLLSLLANLLLVPVISFAVMPLGMASVMLGAAWPPLGSLPAMLASFLNRWTFRLVDEVNGWDGWRTVWPQPSRAWTVCAYGLLGVTMWGLAKRREHREEALARAGTDTGNAVDAEDTVPLDPPAMEHDPGGRRRWALISLAVALLWGGWGIWGYQPAFLHREAEVQFLDVGQGDAILIRTGGGRHVLVDSGGTVGFVSDADAWRRRRDPYEVGRKLLVPLLRARGVRALDALVLTHLDADHIGGAEAVLRDVPVRAVIWNGTWKDSGTAERLLRFASDRGIPVYAASAGQRWRIDGSAEMEVLYPVGDGGAGSAPLPVLAQQNERSVVLLLTLYGRRFLLTGDAEAPAEQAIVDRLNDGGATDFAAAGGGLSDGVDVMKAGHHGSRTSTGETWLRYWQPAEIVVSVGRNNRYGHPHPAVMSRIGDFGIASYRTDRDGEIQYRITPDGRLMRRAKRAPGDAPPLL